MTSQTDPRIMQGIPIRRPPYFTLTNIAALPSHALPDEESPSPCELVKALPSWFKLKRREMDLRSSEYLFPVRQSIFCLDRYNDEWIQWNIFATGDYYASEDLDKVSEILQSLFTSAELEGSTMIDCGANIGNHTLFFATHRQLKFNTIYSIEPAPETFKILQRNIKANGLESAVTPINAAVSDTDGKRLSICHFDKGNLASARFASDDDGITQSIKLDNLGATDVRLLKIDVEGFELNALKGARKLLYSNDCLIYVEAEHLEPIAALLSDINYSLISRLGWRQKDYLFARRERAS